MQDASAARSCYIWLFCLLNWGQADLLMANKDEYVICIGCKSPDTILSKENRLFFLRCEKVMVYISLHFLSLSRVL
ncbi:hypothetical protein K2173_014618 [Erythroxylum novogranatense]|uniref:Translation initiation factor IF2/IF5 domain-containing protein n=1 Tax=Erythroxylum novogranatense TaxID=1862640 RepID=A0AAV8TGG2_9ROSI|nr:hypothetical protein K2173_014618 [Erythroxylum novogranatense]